MIMKSKYIILYLIIISLIITCVVFFNQKENLNTHFKKENNILLQHLVQSRSIREKEILLQTESFFPENWALNDYDNKNIDGVDVFNEKALLVLYIPPGSCSPCLENELKELNALGSINEDLIDRIVVVTSFPGSNEFIAFSNSQKLKNISLFNRMENSEPKTSGTACYFVWKNRQVGNIYIPRMDDGKLNLKFRETILPLIGEPLVLYIINGEEILKSKSYIYELDTEKIEQISVIDPVSGKKEFGEKGKNGVYIIKLPNDK